MSTVTKNKEYYTRADIEGADRARKYQGLLGWSETSAFKTYFNNNLLLNYNITMDDINGSEDIYWEATPILQDKMSRKKLTLY